MCELLAMSSRHATRLTFSLEALSSHSAAPGVSRDGWGVAYYQGHDVALFREPSSASDSPLVRYLESQGPKTTLAISHIRHATQGVVSLANTQPFVPWMGSIMHRPDAHLWGRRHLLTVAHKDTRPAVSLDHKRITLSVRPGADAAKRADVIHEWHKSLLHAVVPALIKKWEPRLKVNVSGCFLQRMKTKWGSCNHQAGHIRLNTELVKKPKDLLEYVGVHEVAHLLAPTHSKRFVAILDKHYPTWREARAELNELPLAAEAWSG